MRKIDTSTWKAFHVTDFFTVLSGRNQLSKVDIDDGNTPVYSSNSFNGGIFGYTTKEPDYEISEDIPFYITFGDHTKAVNIADKSFCVMDNVKVLTTKIRNYNVLHFIITSWLKNVPNLGYARHWSIAEKAKIYLPATSDGQPDWNYMESYMKAVMKESEASLEKLMQADGEKHVLNIDGWRRFHLYDESLFDIDMGTKLDRVKMTQANPDVNFVGRANTNNGITAQVDSIAGITPYEAGNMTLSLGGEYLGSCFVQPEKFYTSQNVVVLIPRWDMPFGVKQFIATTIFRESRLYYKAFIDELNRHIKTDFSFYLPVNASGKPDWAYMDEYMSGVMAESEANLESLLSIG